MIDPHQIKQCPYDPNHKIASCKFQIHLFKCAKQHPEIAAQFEICPFNQTHRLPPHKMEQHLLDCPDGEALLSKKNMNNRKIAEPATFK